MTIKTATLAEKLRQIRLSQPLLTYEQARQQFERHRQVAPAMPQSSKRWSITLKKKA